MLDNQQEPIVLISGDRSLSADSLRQRSRQGASALHDLGVWQGDTVALLLRNDFVFFEASAAAAQLGASPVPLSWHLGAEEIDYILDDCGAKVLIAHADLLTESVLARCGDVHVVAARVPVEISDAYSVQDDEAQVPPGVPEWDQLIEAYAAWENPPRNITAPMFYTSGTTGRPKGVKRKSVAPETLSAIAARTSAAWGFDRDNVKAVMTGPLYHSAPNAYGLQVIRDGGLLVLEPRFDPESLLRLIERHRITHLHMVPTMFVRLLGLPEDRRRAYDVSSLRVVSHGAAPCPKELKQRMIAWWGPVIHEYYAMTEIGIATFCDSAQWLAHPGTVGCAAPGVTLKIVDGDERECSVGDAGEIWVQSEVTSRFTYHRDDEKTQSSRRGDFVATGDMGYLDEDGFLYISDRKSDMVISGGVNIYPAEVENVLVTRDDIQDCAVFGVPDDEFGERLVAIVQSDRELDGTKIAHWLRERIANYKVPREFLFVRDLPREDSGKIKKRVLRSDYLQSAQSIG